MEHAEHAGTEPDPEQGVLIGARRPGDATS